MSETAKYGHLFVTDLKKEPVMPLDFKEMYQRFAKRVMWIDSEVVPGAFQMNVSWYKSVPEINPIFDSHSHDCPEIVGFFGSDPENPYELGGEIGVEIEGEMHVFKNSFLVFVPPHLMHNNHILRVDRPIFHFSVVTDGDYNGAAYK